ncbi:hypothetical protein [Rhodococcus sp. MEB032]|uniref:Eco57I restriction-modification methylase domain-containing protein n=1 Tax=Rhodococcus sp. MEB032 TaxID=3040322 RepID=UPI00254C6F67|nr:hypothetical protein [Rhodococcus sp. MEB032]
MVPTSGWGSTVEAKEAKELAPDALADLKTWRKELKPQPTTAQVRKLKELAGRVETLWLLAHKRLEIAEREIRRPIPVWGRETESAETVVTRDLIEASLADENGAYRRLRRVMDAWCALWFWPLVDDDATVKDDLVQPPTLDQWIDTLTGLLGTSIGESKPEKKHGQLNLFSIQSWDELEAVESNELLFAKAAKVDELKKNSPWLVVAERLAARQGFFHWELDFAAVFSRGGFDLQVGNPPWVRPRSDVDALLSEGDPWFQLAVKPTQSEYKAKRNATLEIEGISDLVLGGTSDVAATAAFVGDARQYPHLMGLQPDLYRCFMEQTWRHNSRRGRVGLIHLESHFTDEKAGRLREATYERLRRHWHFVNERKLFEIKDQKMFGVNIYGSSRKVEFLNSCWLYLPETVERSLRHDGTGYEPGLKDLDGNWDLRPHRDRVVTVTDSVLASWQDVTESGEGPVRQTRMVYTVNQSSANVLSKVAQSPRVGQLNVKYSRGWDESIDRRKGLFEAEWGVANSWADVILQGSHLFVGTPRYKVPNKEMKHNQDWYPTDYESLAAESVPTTSFKPSGSRERYDSSYNSWEETDRDGVIATVFARDVYRVAWRRMAANTGERTLAPAIIPPGAAHVNTIRSAWMPEHELAVVAGTAASILSDFVIRAVPKNDIIERTFARLPRISGKIAAGVAFRALRINCLTDAYSRLWEQCFGVEMQAEAWAGGFAHSRRKPLGEISPMWTSESPLRIGADRRQALVEIDALVALGLGLTADELCTIYRTQFPVLYGFDRKTYLYDFNGRVVPNEVLSVWRKKGDAINEDERTATNPAGNTYTYELPFQFLDREADMREAYTEFERRLGITGGTAAGAN